MSNKEVNYHIPKPRITFSPPIYHCLPAPGPFHLDGNIEKDFWKDIPYTCDFADISGPDFPVPRFRTRAKMCWDQDNLYIAALLEGDEIWASVTEHDDVIFRDNDFEIFVDPDSDTQKYYEFEMNALNTVWDLMLTKAYRDNGSPINSFDIKGLRTAVHINGSLNEPGPQNISWSVEVVFPFTSFMECLGDKKRPVPGDYWRMNFSRVQWLVDVKDGRFQKRTGSDGQTPLPEDNWVWAPTGVINIHYPELWGFVFFADSPAAQYSIPEIERQKWVLRTLYYEQHRYWDENQKFTDNLEELTSQPLPFPVCIETTRHSFEISCQAADGSGILYLLADGNTVFLPGEDAT